LEISCRVGHPAKIRKAETRRQKHDRRDAALLLDLLTEDRFPSIWMPSSELRDLRALLRHRHQWVRMRTRVMNALQGIALAHGMRRGASLWSRSGQAMSAARGRPADGIAGVARPFDDADHGPGPARRRARARAAAGPPSDDPPGRRL